MDGDSPSPAISVGDGEVLRLAVTLAAARGLLSPVDLAADGAEVLRRLEEKSQASIVMN